ncbi:MAG: NAD(P)/FAD-dependent oxidoreductase [Candidatus Diapherotrites archaeon]|nr:NAD(P)/FAD-dependent oxidoreductase [Candidatus Diapherotrites archaeon]
MENYDVIIVGCGPAGLRAAKVLAENKINVLALDKKQEIGVPVRCGEGLGLGWFKRLNLKPNSAWAVQPIKGAALYSPTGKKVEIRFEEVSGYILERRMFEKYLAREAALKGACIKVKHHVLDVKRKGSKVEVFGKYLGDEFKYSANIIIAADGVDSLTARRLGLNTTNKLVDIDSGFQYEMAGIDFEDPDLIHLYFGNEVAPRGYVWLFPKGDHEANVGVGIAGYREETAKYYLDKFISSRESLAKGSIIHINSGAVPVGGFLDNMVLDNLLVCGDAAHQVDPTHGGGIGLSMEAATIAAEVAVEAIKKVDYSQKFLSRYNKLWYEKRGNALKQRLKARIFMEQLTDDEFDAIADNLSGEDILKLAGGELSEKAKFMARLLIKKPSIAGKIAKSLR